MKALRAWGIRIVGGVAALALLTGSDSMEPAQTAFRGDYEVPLYGGWSRFQAASVDRLVLGAPENAPPRQGSKVGSFTVLGSDLNEARNFDAGGVTDGRLIDTDPNNPRERAEVVWLEPDPSWQTEGKRVWYRWWTRWNSGEYPPVPERLPGQPAWQIFTQFHHQGLEGIPPVAFDVVTNRVMADGVQRSGEWIVLDTLTDGLNDIEQRPIAPLVRDVWHEFIVRIRWSSNKDDGLVEVWYDTSPRNPPTLRVSARTLIDQSNYVKQGLYRSHEDVARTVHHDGFSASTRPPSETNGASTGP
jgi:hypothetical protein